MNGDRAQQSMHLPTAQQVAEPLQANQLSSAQLDKESLRLGSAQQAT